MKKITVDYSKTFIEISEKEIYDLQQEVTSAHNMLHNRSGKGSDFTGWLNLPVKYNFNEVERMAKTAEKIQEISDVMIVIGIGGSYLGAKAAVEILSGSVKNKGVEILFAGNSISADYLSDLLEYVQNKDFCINVISKS